MSQRKRTSLAMILINEKPHTSLAMILIDVAGWKENLQKVQQDAWKRDGFERFSLQPFTLPVQ